MPRPIHNASSYLPGLDGIRALAVTFVILYHLSIPGFSGGLLGVGVFFTLSGFLITSLLISSHEKHGNLGLKTFWLRRARRLLPAVALVLVTTLGAAAIVVPAKLEQYWWEALSAFFYVNNWHTIGANQSYFDRFGGPSPLSHMWSLSIEEQFYIVWPLLLALMYLVLKRRTLITGVIVLLSLGSFWLLSELATAGFDNTRAYEGTDTRAGALLLGAALAFWWPARKHRVTHNQRCVLDVLGLAGLATITYLCLTMPDTSTSLYTWGLLALTLATMAVLMAAVAPQTLVASLLSIQPLRWIGERSYGIYLWHMPLVAFLPGLLRAESLWVSSVAVIAGTLLLATLSWRFVEDPIRRHGFRAAFTTPRPAEDKLPAQFTTALIAFFTRIVEALTNAQRKRLQAVDAFTPIDPEVPAEPPTEAAERHTSPPIHIEPLREEPVSLNDSEQAVVPVPLIEEHLELEVSNPEPTAEPEMSAELETHVEADSTTEALEPPAEPTTVEPVVMPADESRRSPVRAMLTVGAVVLVGMGTMVGVSKINPDLPVISALSTAGDTDDAPLTENAGPPPLRTGPTLPAAQRKTKCTKLLHVGDSTSIGMNAAELQTNPALRLSGQYKSVGVKDYESDVVGGRSSLEEVDGQPNAHDSIVGDVSRGFKGCWVMAMGINDAANMEVGGPGPIDMRIDRLLAPLKGQPVMWPTIITNKLNQNPAYSNQAMQRFNRALLNACKRYPNLRVYDWAGETQQSWFSTDGVHYTEPGYVERAHRFAIAVATVFPANDLPPAGSLLSSTTAVVRNPA
ncbi:MAG: acyltransferase family protein [Gordonia sp. (in: high G+C Gram-positive bacteria)]